MTTQKKLKKVLITMPFPAEEDVRRELGVLKARSDQLYGDLMRNSKRKATRAKNKN
jgi:hypothetical protein